MPGISLAALVLVYGAYALSDGVVATVTAFTGRSGGDGFPWWALLTGVTGIVAGLLTFAYPGLTALVLLYVIAAWHIGRGVTDIVLAVKLRKEIEGEFWLALAGALSALFGLFLFARPGAGALALLWMIAGFSIVFGVIAIALGVKLRSRATS